MRLEKFKYPLLWTAILLLTGLVLAKIIYHSTTYLMATSPLIEKTTPGETAISSIRIVTEGTYPPFSMVDENGEPGGFDIEISKALCEQLENITCTFQIDTWPGIIQGMADKKYDVIANSMSITEERKKHFTFSDPYYSNKLSFVARQILGGRTASKLNLIDKHIGVQSSTVSAHYLNGISHLMKVEIFDTQEAVWAALQQDQVDAIMTDKLLALEWLQEGDHRKHFELVGDDIDINDKVGFAFRKDEKHLSALFNQALKTILDNDTYASINSKYFPFSIY